jgi:methionyl-tRNA formyltransferase
VSPIETARVVFAGTPDFAVPALQQLIDAGAKISLVLTQPDRHAGRGRRLTESPVKQLARANDIEVRQPAVLDETFRLSLPPERPDVLVVAAYGLLLPEWLLDWPTVAPVNIHASLLPRWRGAAPIQLAIAAGDEETGISIMRMTPGLDCGPVYSRRATPIGARETAGQLSERLAAMGGELLIEALPGILASNLEPEAQDEARATHAPKIRKADAVLDWSLSAVELERRVRAFNPWPVAETRFADGERLRVWQAEAVAGHSKARPGSVLAAEGDGIDVATADGILRLKRVQAPGKREMSAAAWLAAHDLGGVVFVGPR